MTIEEHPIFTKLITYITGTLNGVFLIATASLCAFTIYVWWKDLI